MKARKITPTDWPKAETPPTLKPGDPVRNGLFFERCRKCKARVDVQKSRLGEKDIYCAWCRSGRARR